MADVGKILKEVINEEFSSKLVDINQAVNKSLASFNDKYKIYGNQGVYRVDCNIFLGVESGDLPSLEYAAGRDAYKFGVKKRHGSSAAVKLNDSVALYRLYFYSEKNSFNKSNKPTGAYLMPTYNTNRTTSQNKIFIPNFSIDDIYDNGLENKDRLVKINLGGKKVKLTNSDFAALYKKQIYINGAMSYDVKSELTEDFYIWIDNIVKYEDRSVLKNK